MLSKIVTFSKEQAAAIEFNQSFGHIFKKADDYKESDELINEKDLKEDEEDGEMLSDSEVQDPSEKVMPLTNKDAD